MSARKYTKFISSVEHDEWDIIFNRRNKSDISKHPCIFLSIILLYKGQSLKSDNFYRKAIIKNDNFHMWDYHK
jgi:hypothetical protein